MFFEGNLQKAPDGQCDYKRLYVREGIWNNTMCITIAYEPRKNKCILELGITDQEIYCFNRSLRYEKKPLTDMLIQDVGYENPTWDYTEITELRPIHITQDNEDEKKQLLHNVRDEQLKFKIPSCEFDDNVSDYHGYPEHEFREITDCTDMGEFVQITLPHRNVDDLFYSKAVIRCKLMPYASERSNELIVRVQLKKTTFLVAEKGAPAILSILKKYKLVNKFDITKPLVSYFEAILKFCNFDGKEYQTEFQKMKIKSLDDINNLLYQNDDDGDVLLNDRNDE